MRGITVLVRSAAWMAAVVYWTSAAHSQGPQPRQRSPGAAAAPLRSAETSPGNTPLPRATVDPAVSGRRVSLAPGGAILPSAGPAPPPSVEQQVASEPVASAFAGAFDDPPPHPLASVDAASFNGVQPGETTAQKLIEKWGEGKQLAREGNETVLGYSIESFSQVEVTVAEGVVRSIVVNLDPPTPPDTLAHQLQLDDVRPVNVPDDAGGLLGQSYPERGVLFSMTPDGKRVTHVMLEKVDLAPFVFRAETDLYTHTRSSLTDLDYVLAREPRNARALWLRARLYATCARYDEAMASVEAALDMEPNHPAYRLTRGEILGLQGRYEEATSATKDVLGMADVPDELKAKAMCQLGDLLAESPAHDYKLAIEHHMSAVKAADPLSVDKRLAVRRAAKLLLIDAHLAVANDIASGFWQQKDQSSAKWLDRAKNYAEDVILHEDGDPALRLRVARGALAACAGAEGKIDSAPWARMALQTGKPVIAAADDPWTKLRLQWELGLALCDGVMTDDFRGVAQHAITNTSLTATFLEAGAKGRRETPEDAYRLGVLYYRLGSLHAVGRKDHKTAVTWYEKAYPLLDRPIPLAHSKDQGRYGEWLVSMGLSYWEVGMRDFAVQLTDAGMQHVEEAVNRKLVDGKALAIPYANLAQMHKSLGHADEAQNFAQLAAKFSPDNQKK